MDMLIPGSTVIGALIGSVATVVFFYMRRKQVLYVKAEAANQLRLARESIDRERKDATIDLKNELNKRRTEYDLEIRKNKIEHQQMQNKLQKRQDTLDQREMIMDDLRKELQGRERDMAKRLDVFEHGRN